MRSSLVPGCYTPRAPVSPCAGSVLEMAWNGHRELYLHTGSLHRRRTLPAEREATRRSRTSGLDVYRQLYQRCPLVPPGARYGVSHGHGTAHRVLSHWMSVPDTSYCDVDAYRDVVWGAGCKEAGISQGDSSLWRSLEEAKARSVPRSAQSKMTCSQPEMREQTEI
eukprot:1716181-Rhodomonas_salina.5